MTPDDLPKLPNEPDMFYWSTDLWTGASSRGGELLIVSGSKAELLGTEENFTRVDKYFVLISKDGGEQWIDYPTPTLFTSVASSSNGQWLAAVSLFSGRIYTSENFGETWVARDAPDPFGNIEQACVSISISDSGKEMVTAAEFGQIYTSENFGETWDGNPTTNGRQWESVAMASGTEGQKLVAVECCGPIQVSDDGGAIWNPRDRDRDWTSVAVSSDGQTMVAVGDDPTSIYVSANGGESWVSHESPRRWTSVACSADCTKIVAAERGGSIYTSAPTRTTVTDGWLAGGQYDAVDLLFVGEGVWVVPDYTTNAGSGFTVH